MKSFIFVKNLSQILVAEVTPAGLCDIACSPGFLRTHHSHMYSNVFAHSNVLVQVPTALVPDALQPRPQRASRCRCATAVQGWT